MLLGRPCTAPLASRCSARAPTRMSPSCRLWIGAARFYRVRNDKTGWEPRTLFNVVEFMMHDKDCSGTIDMDECMEILFRRFGKDLLESKVNEFMGQDENGDADITFTEFLHMDLRSDSGDSKTPSLMLSQGVVKTTLEENKKLLKLVADQQARSQQRAGA